jgi:hypothetical protein
MRVYSVSQAMTNIFQDVLVDARIFIFVFRNGGLPSHESQLIPESEAQRRGSPFKHLLACLP